MAQTLAALSAAPLELIWQSEVIATARTKEEPVLGCFLVMEEREQLFGDLKRYRALLRYTTDEQASAAIKQLIREIYERLDSNKVEVRLTRSSGANLMSARPLLTHAEIGADLGNRGYRRDSHQCSYQRIFDCGEIGTSIDEIL